MRDVWRWRESPALIARNAAYGLARRPACPTVVTPIQQGWRHSQVESARHTRVSATGPDILRNRVLVHQLPTVAPGPAPQGTLLRQSHHALVGTGQKGDRCWAFLVLEVLVVSQPKYTTLRADQELRHTLPPLLRGCALCPSRALWRQLVYTTHFGGRTVRRGASRVI